MDSRNTGLKRERGENRERRGEKRKKDLCLQYLVLPCVCLSSAALAGGRARTKVPAKIEGREEKKEGGRGRNLIRALCAFTAESGPEVLCRPAAMHGSDCIKKSPAGGERRRHFLPQAFFCHFFCSFFAATANALEFYSSMKK